MKPPTPPAPAEPTAAPQALAEQRRSWLSLAGPGLVAGASDDDPSGVGTYAQAGAQFGMGMLWVMFFTFPLMAGVQLISARIGRVTGSGLAANLRHVVPRWLLWPLLFALYVTNTINIGADLAAMGEASALVLSGHPSLYAFALGAVSTVLLVLLPYARYVTVLKWLALTLLAYVGIAFVVNVSWISVLKDTLLPPIQWDKRYVQSLLAVLGTTISPYLFFWQSAQEVEVLRAATDEAPLRSAPHQAALHLRRMKADTWAGMAVSNVVGFFIILTTAVTLHARGVTDIDSAAQAAKALEPVAGHLAVFLFALGIVGTGLLGVPVLAGSAAYALAEAFGWRRGLDRRLTAAPAFYMAILAATACGAAMPLLHVNAMKALVASSMLNGVVAVPILVAMMVLAQRVAVMGRFAIRGGLLWLGWLATALMTLAAAGLLL